MIRKDMEMLLLERFPVLFRQLRFGVECAEGWYDLIWECSKELEALHPEIEYVQIKEKFAALRVYLICPQEIRPKANEIIDEYCDKSGDICERCGTTENVSLHMGGWNTTLCDACHALWEVDGGEVFHKQYEEDRFLEEKRKRE
jgi:hypothetical protein